MWCGECDISSHTFFLTTQDGTRLFVRDWEPAHRKLNTPGLSILLLHGLAEHSLRHQGLVDYFLKKGFAVRAYDHRGHGHSDGKRGDTPHLTALMDDAHEVLQHFIKQGQAAPFLFGHSMGGLIAAYLASVATVPIKGLILSSPALGFRLSFFSKKLSQLLLRIAPHYTMPFYVSREALSHDPSVFKAYKEDPLVHSQISATLFNSLLFALNHVHQCAPSWDTLTLLLAAQKDCLVDPAGSQRFFTRLQQGYGTAHFYPDYYHEIFNEVGKDRVFNDLTNWLDNTFQY